MSLPAYIRLVREISRSSIATVWEGWDERLGRKVLVKSLHPQLARDEDLRHRFEREARVVASLAHPNIVRIYELFADEEQLSLIFEFVEGQTLRELLRARKILPPAVALAIAHEILAGLSAAHEKGIIHRDLKPENVLLSLQGEVRITDFGWAMVRDLPRLTHEDALPGTPAYMAPEQAAGEEVTPRTDLFALGLMLFEMLTGQAALKGETWQECLQELVRYQPPRFPDYREQISPELERILTRLLDRNPARRFESAQAANEALEEIARDWQLPAASDILREAIAQPTLGDLPGILSVSRQRKQRGRRLAVAGIIIAVLVLLWLIFRPLPPPEILPSDEKTDFVELPPIDTTSPIVLPLPEQEELLSSQTESKRDTEKTVQVEPPKQIAALDDSLILEPVPVPPETVRLWIHSEPAAQVEIDGKKIGWTPLEGRLLIGTHRIAFPVERFPITPETTIVLKEGQEAGTFSISLYQYVGVIDTIVAEPWARVYLDDALVDSTPGARQLFVTLNDTHTVRLEHPEYPPWEREFFFQRGDPPRQIRVDLRKGR
ncbi:MAG: serine/threonine-protein kinase [bacterium]